MSSLDNSTIKISQFPGSGRNLRNSREIQSVEVLCSINTNKLLPWRPTVAIKIPHCFPESTSPEGTWRMSTGEATFVQGKAKDPPTGRSFLSELVQHAKIARACTPAFPPSVKEPLRNGLCCSVVRRTVKSTLVMSSRVPTQGRCPAIKFHGELNKHLMSASSSEKDFERDRHLRCVP